MRALKLSIFSSLLALILFGSYAHASVAYSEPQRVYHNSGEKVYQTRQRQIISRPAATVAKKTEPSTQNSGGFLSNSFIGGSILGDKCTSRGKGGSMFGGDCSRPTKDGSIFPGGSCSIPKGECYKACKQNCGSPVTKKCGQACAPCFKCPAAPVVPVVYQNTCTTCANDVYDTIHKCKDLAPVELKWVDFKITKDKPFSSFSNNLGNYRFRIFGCRRFDKHTMLNQGRIIQKDLQFIRIFEDMVSDCYNIIKTPDDLCLPENDKPVPEYIITAEITDYFMNVCDKFDWGKSKKEDLRTGSSEMTVTWRIMDITGKTVLWKGESTGYGELEEGEYNGETVLIERAFADAVNSLRNVPGFERQLAIRVSPEELAQQKQQLIEFEKITNPIKCDFQKELELAKTCGIKTVCYDVDTCTNTVLDEQVFIDETSGANMTSGLIIEDGGTRSNAYIDERITTTIDEASGICISGAGTFDENGFFLDENTGQLVPCSTIDETGGVYSSGATTLEETVTTIDETSGICISGSGTFDENSFFLDEATGQLVPCSTIDETGGAYSSGATTLEENITTIDETGGSIISGAEAKEDIIIYEKVETVVVEDGGTIHETIVEEVTEESGVHVSGETVDNNIWVETVETSHVSEKGFACIICNSPNDTASAKNITKLKSSMFTVTNPDGSKCSGLLISEELVLVSGDIITKNIETYSLEAQDGTKFTGTVVRVNPIKNTALLLLDRKAAFTPLAIEKNLPETGKATYSTCDTGLGKKLDEDATIMGYRYTDEIGAEIIVSSAKTLTCSILVDRYSNVSGLGHSNTLTDDGNKLYLPIADAIKSVGLTICNEENSGYTAWYERSVSQAVETNVQKAPEEMPAKQRK